MTDEKGLKERLGARHTLDTPRDPRTGALINPDGPAALAYIADLEARAAPGDIIVRKRFGRWMADYPDTGAHSGGHSSALQALRELLKRPEVHTALNTTGEQ